MKFVFLAAGKGTRIFKKINTNKCLIKLKKRTIIEILIENIPKKYFKDITIVTGFNHLKIINATKKYKINYLQNKDYKNTEMLHSLSLALKEINDDIFFSYSDIVYDKIIIKKIIQKNFKNICVPINMKWKKVWKHRGTDIKTDAETLDFKNNKLLEIGNKITNIKKVKGQFMGLFYIPKDKRKIILDILNKKSFKKKHLTFFINYLIKKKVNISVIQYSRKWYEFDNYSDLVNYKTFK
jgi:L-glutamine-phosphate cytidylyltransferase